MKVRLSVSELRIFVGNIPNSKSKVEIMAEFNRFAGKIILFFFPFNWKIKISGGFFFLYFVWCRFFFQLHQPV